MSEGEDGLDALLQCLEDEDLAEFDAVDVEDKVKDDIKEVQEDLNTSTEDVMRKELMEMREKMKKMEKMLAEKENVAKSPVIPVPVQQPLRSIQAAKPKSSEKNSSFADFFASESLPQSKEETTQLKSKTPVKPKKPALSDVFVNAFEFKPQPTMSASGLLETPSKTIIKSNQKSETPVKSAIKSVNVEIDISQDKCPHSGLRITNRKVSKGDFSHAISTRKFLKLGHLPTYFVNKQDIAGDWVTAGVLVQKVGPLKTSKGDNFAIWKLSDLNSFDNLVSLFLFKEVYNTHWKEQVGTVVGLLNPTYMPPRDQDKGRKSELGFTVDNEAKLLRLGMSVDYGTCKGTQKNGEKCKNFVNKALVEFCDFHIVKVHAQKRNNRMALAGVYSPRPNEKNAGKLAQARSETQAFSHAGSVYYPNMKQTLKPNTPTDSPAAVPLKKSQNVIVSSPLIDVADFKERLKLPTPGTLHLKRVLEGNEESDRLANMSASKRMKWETPNKIFNKVVKVPTLGGTKASGSGFVNLSAPVSRNNAKAAAIVKRMGGIKKNDPNSLKPQMTALEKKRLKDRSLGLEKEKVVEAPILNGPSDLLFNRPKSCRTSNSKSDSRPASSSKSQEKAPSKSSLSSLFNVADINSAEGQRLAKAKSINAGAVREKEIETTLDYFNAVEKNENIDMKLQNIKEIKITVYHCHICNTTTQKMRDECTAANHLVKKGPSVKKFFQCRGCSNRTDVIGGIYPTEDCSKCGKVAWQKCSMYREKKGPTLDTEKVVIRGLESKYVGQVKNDVV